MTKLSLTLRFVIGSIILVFILSMVTQNYYSRQQEQNMKIRMQEKVKFLREFYAFLIADSLQRKDDITLLQVMNTLEQDQEIFSVIVVDQTGEVRYHQDSQKVGAITDDPTILNALKTGESTITDYKTQSDNAVELVSPLRIQGVPQALGAVRLDLTYKHIDDVIKRSQRNFLLHLIGLMLTGASLTFWVLNRWVLAPLGGLRNAVAAVNPSNLEATLPEPSDEFGPVCVAINDLITRMKQDTRDRETDILKRSEDEKGLIQNLVRSLLPEARVIIADKDNLIVSDSGNGTGQHPGGPRHLLDLITDTNFANLVKAAFQGEGDVARGPVSFEDKEYEAAVLSLPAHQAQQMKTLIALKPVNAK